MIKNNVVIKKSEYGIYLFISIFILTLSNCVVFVGTKYGTILELFGYSLLLGGILLSYFNFSVGYRKKYSTKYVIALIFLLTIGILVQNLTIYRKIILLFAIITIITVTTMADNFISRKEYIKVMAYGIFVGIIISNILCILNKQPLVINTAEGTFGIYRAYSGGIKEKNIATMAIAVIISLIYCQNEGKVNAKDYVIILLSFSILVLSNSRGAWIVFAVYVFVRNIRKISIIKKSERKIAIIVLMLLLASFGYIFFKKIVMNSTTYLYRYRGLMNFINKFKDNPYRMWFGIADLVYDKSHDYVYTVRSITGWNGTLEIAWLNVLIKNGILGVIGYIIIFFRYFIIMMRTDNIKIKTEMLSLIVMVLASSLVATYMQDVHGLFGIYCYLFISHYCGRIRETEYERKYRNEYKKNWYNNKTCSA